jgi:hypothetical protein
MRRLSNRWAIALGAIGLLGAGLFLALPSLDAAIAQRRVVCDGTKDHVIVLKDKQPFHARTQGSLTAGIGESFETADGRRGTSLTVEDVFSEGEAEGLGSVTFKLDAERTKAEGLESSVVGNREGEEFPATQTMRFHFTAQLEGREYRSVNPAVVVSTCVGSLPPEAGTVYNLTENVTMASEGGETLTLQAGKAFTAGG